MRPQEQPLGYVAADERRGEGMDAASGWPREISAPGPAASEVGDGGRRSARPSRWPDGPRRKVGTKFWSKENNC